MVVSRPIEVSLLARARVEVVEGIEPHHVFPQIEQPIA